MVAVCVTGKPFILAAGADLKGVALVTDRQQAVEAARLGHRVFGRLGDGPVPTFVFVNGLALGGGPGAGPALHLPDGACRCRRDRLPGDLPRPGPGVGRAWLLPNLVGADRAVTVIIENALNQNRMLTGPQAAELGIADACSMARTSSSSRCAGRRRSSVAMSSSNAASTATSRRGRQRSRADGKSQTKGPRAAPAPYARSS